MSWTIAHFEDLSVEDSTLALTLFPERMPVRWSVCGAVAEYIAAYLSPGEAHPELRNIANYVLNELVENAVKFSSGPEIQVAAALGAGTLVLRVTNHIAVARCESVRARLASLLDGDPTELMVARVEANAEAGPDSGSGLGYLTMMSDYSAQLAWHLEHPPGSPPRLITIARVPLRAKD